MRVFKLFIVFVAFTLLLPAVALTGTPTAYLEDSKVIATGTQIKAYRVPTKGADGKVHYYDITVPLAILDTGKPDISAQVKSVVSPNVGVNDFVPGTYDDGNGTTCTLVTSPFGGRTEVILNCVNNWPYTQSATWYTGPIIGNPFEAELKTAGVNTVPGNSNYAWGKVGNAVNWWCFGNNNILAARQVNDTITIFNYGSDSISNCQINIMKTLP